jgi:hypothetical protein
MENGAWIALLRRIPPDQHANTMLTMLTGKELAVQTLIRFDKEFVIIRGRVAGSSDAGRIFFVPYSHIEYAGFQQLLNEEHLAAICGEGSVPLEAPAVEVSAPATETVRGPAKAGGTVPAEPCKSNGTVTPNGSGRLANRAPLPLKSELLERLRSRSNQGVSLRPPVEQ